MNTCPNCGMVKGLHASILPGCMCPTTPQDTFTPDWNKQTVLVEDAIQRMTKELKESSEKVKKLEKIIADQESMLERQTARIVGLQDEIRNLTGEE